MLLCIVGAIAHPNGHAAGANPTGPAVLGQRLDVEVAGDTLTLVYLAEVPLRRLLEEGNPQTAPQAMLPRLAGAVTVRWEDVPLAVQWGPGTAAPGLSGFYDLQVTGTATLPAAAGTVRLRNGNFPDEPSFFATAVTIPGDRVVTATDLARVKDGRVRYNRHGAWLKDESAREPWFTLRPAHGWEVADAGPLPERLAGRDALAFPAGRVAAIVGAGSGLAGLAWWWRRRRGR